MNILITGANRGLGLEFVRQYAQDGHRIFACCREPDKAEDLKQLTDDCTNRISLHKLDVSDCQAILNFSDELKGETIDLLLNNAGIYGKNTPFGTVDPKIWLATFQINTIAPLKMAEVFFPHVNRSEKKVIAIVTSKMGSISDNTSGGSYHYRSSKAAVNIVGKNLANDLKKHGFIVLLLHPGWVVTDMGGPHALIQPNESVEGMRKVIEQAEWKDSGQFFAYDGAKISW